MDIDTGQMVSVTTQSHRFERNANAPGIVDVVDLKSGVRIKLRANKEDSREFVTALLKICSVDIAYKKSEFQSYRDSEEIIRGIDAVKGRRGDD